MNNIILNLSSLCIKEIISYLNHENILLFLNSCNQLNNLKKIFIPISLNREYSNHYLYNNNFRNNINKYSNIRLNLFDCIIPNNILSDNISHIRISYCYFNISVLKNIKNIDIIGYINSDLSDLKNANSISLSECNNVYNIDVLSNVKRLFITRCHNITNIDNLNNKLLYVLNCDGITNINNNNNINKIYITYCKNLQNINKLKLLKNYNIYI